VADEDSPVAEAKNTLDVATSGKPTANQVRACPDNLQTMIDASYFSGCGYPYTLGPCEIPLPVLYFTPSDTTSQLA